MVESACCNILLPLAYFVQLSVTMPYCYDTVFLITVCCRPCNELLCLVVQSMHLSYLLVFSRLVSFVGMNAFGCWLERSVNIELSMRIAATEMSFLPCASDKVSLRLDWPSMIYLV